MSAEEDNQARVAPVPDAVGRELVACITCGLCKTVRQYEESGCENCDPRAMHAHDIADHTTQNFSGLIAIMDPDASWCAKWVRKKKYCPGVYALHLNQAQ